MAIDWSDIYSPDVRNAFRVALSDKQLTHDEVVDILQSLLKDGELTGTEMNDLHKIARTAETIPARSKQMLVTLGEEVLQNLGYSPFYFSTTDQRIAVNILCSFLKRSAPQKFSKLDRDRVGIGLLLRVANPNIINQRNAGLCGPVSFLYGVAFDKPSDYAQYGVDLFENGRAKIKSYEIVPGTDCRNYSPPAPLAHADWLTAASLRDSENLFLDYDSVSRDGGSDVKDLAKWFERAGYKDIHKVTTLDEHRTDTDLRDINDFYSRGYRVGLVIHSNLLDPAKQGTASDRGNHWVVLRSPVTEVGTNVNLTVWTWGQVQRKVGPISKAGFLGHWYSYVAARPF